MQAVTTRANNGKVSKFVMMDLYKKCCYHNVFTSTVLNKKDVFSLVFYRVFLADYKQQC
jgi:hypothetical protein